MRDTGAHWSTVNDRRAAQSAQTVAAGRRKPTESTSGTAAQREKSGSGRSLELAAQTSTVRADYVTTQYNARQTSYLPRGNNDAYRETQRDAMAARNNVDTPDQEIALLSNNSSFGSRVKNAVLGGVGRSLASDVNSTANVYDLTRGARERMMNDNLADYEHGLDRAQNDLRQMEESGASIWEAEQQRMIVRDWQRKVDAMVEAIAAQPNAVQATYGLADDIKSSADASIENAKRGLDQFGRLVVDVGARATQMGTDAAKSWYLLNRFNVNSGAEDFVKRLPLAGRIYGENTQIARQEGADAKSAAVYGAITAIADTKIKKQFDGLSRFYGKAWADDKAKDFARIFKNNRALQYIAKAGFNDFGEGVLESVATDLANQLLKPAYNGKDPIQNGIETEWDRVARNALINTIIAILAGDSGMESN